MPLMAPDYGVD